MDVTQYDLVRGHILELVGDAGDDGVLLELVATAQERYGTRPAFPKGRLRNHCTFTKVDLEARGFNGRVPGSGRSGSGWRMSHRRPRPPSRAVPDLVRRVLGRAILRSKGVALADRMATWLTAGPRPGFTGLAAVDVIRTFQRDPPGSPARPEP